MPKYRKKAVVVDAVVPTMEIQHYSVSVTADCMEEWFIEALKSKVVEIKMDLTPEGYIKIPVGAKLVVNTLEGVMEVSPGDSIIRGVKGELYPCKADIFKKTYEKVGRPGLLTFSSGLFVERLSSLVREHLSTYLLLESGFK